MNKALESLHLIRVYLDTEGELEMSNELNIIENALKEGIEYKDKYCKLQAERIVEKVLNKQKLKALEIIKEKKVNVWCISKVSLEEYNTKFVNQDWRKLTKEEYDLLKEVFINE